MARSASLVDDAALRLAVRPETADTHLPRTRITQPMRIPMRDLAVGVFVLLAAIWVGDQWLRATTARSVPWPLATEPSSLFAPPTVLQVMVTSRGQRAAWITTDADLRSSVEMWKRMHLEDWNLVPQPLRETGLDNMLLRFRDTLNSPAVWDTMTTLDWDTVPQPVRTVAYRRMVVYWSGFYDVGAAFDLDPGVVSETLAAIIMSESWFDHRAVAANRDGTLDVGLAQASQYARRRLRELHASGRVDASFTDSDYLNPWKATQFVALWMGLMLDEMGGDLDLAIRAYNRGSTDAGDRFGADYLAAVQRRLSRYIRNRDAPLSWDFVWRRARELLRVPTAPPAMRHH